MAQAAQLNSVLQQHTWYARLVLLGGGALAPLVFAPFNVWPLALALPVLFWWLTARQAPKTAFWHGWWFGAGFFGTGISWVYFSMRAVETPVWISLVLTIAFCLAMAFLFALQAGLPALARRRVNLHWLIYPLLWLAFEGLRSTLFTGMPWLIWGTVATDTVLRGWLPIGGVFLVSLLLLVTAACFWQVSPARRLTLAAPLLLILLTWGGGTLLLDRDYTELARETPITAAALQGNVPQDIKWQRQQIQRNLDLYEALNAEHPEADLLVWPETAITAFPEEIQSQLEALEQRLSDNGQGLVAGLPLWGEGRDYYNAMRGFGTASGDYNKQHLVPFGEYLPLQGLLQGLIAFFDLPMSGFSAGAAEQAPIILNIDGEDWRLGTLICYEAAYPGLSRTQTLDTHLLVVISNDAWFGRSLAPAQHLQITRARAIENQRDMVRATQNGISAVVNHHGQLMARTPQFEAATVAGQLFLRTGTTPYQRWGEGLVWLLSTLTLLAALVLTLGLVRR
ncbi:MAG: apolipoprotein N-acyltransferase [Natronospirillum sp.]|uniref:apolipoprotein N-acyltransferase n=1 Tax=Natronospirillum sp. TaxID=2812955 RepID=UPI0025F6C72A|nr:apolipoprotein N-acyltransferase [Natronospirillum sp.]MCH8551081.1 apolipoprotein N-acyltransferase [Natronospirillum sp.]